MLGYWRTDGFVSSSPLLEASKPSREGNAGATDGREGFWFTPPCPRSVSAWALAGPSPVWAAGVGWGRQAALEALGDGGLCCVGSTALASKHRNRLGGGDGERKVLSAWLPSPSHGLWRGRAPRLLPGVNGASAVRVLFCRGGSSMGA